MSVRIDHAERVSPLRATACEWCGRADQPTFRYGTTHNGQTYWSPQLCSIDCHHAMYEEPT